MHCFPVIAASKCFFLHALATAFTFGAYSPFKNYMSWKCHGSGTKKQCKKIEPTAARYRKKENRRESYDSKGTFPSSIPPRSLLGHPVMLPTNKDAAHRVCVPWMLSWSSPQPGMHWRAPNQHHFCLVKWCTGFWNWCYPFNCFPNHFNNKIEIKHSLKFPPQLNSRFYCGNF